MKFKVVIIKSAKHDLQALRDYIIQKFLHDTWIQTSSRLREVMRSLETLPFAGSLPEEIEKLNLNQYRQVISGMNRIIYEVRQDTVYIHAIADVRRDMTSLLTKRLLRFIP